jgi:hypothetical protein
VLVAQSISTYNNVEHLFFKLPETADYMLRVKWTGEVFDTVDDENSEVFALAWWGTPVAGGLADYNQSGLVDQADLDLVLLHWGTELIDPAPAGWTNDLPAGLVDQQELDKVLLGWGNTPTAAVTTAAVPEPSGIALGLVMLIAGAVASKRLDTFGA